MTAASDSARVDRICGCSSAGKTSMMPVHGLGGVVGVEGAEHQVAGAGCFDGESDGLHVAELARPGSRQDLREVRRGARWQTTWVWEPTSRWLTSARSLLCTNSTGSSIVRMWSFLVLLASSMMAARVVDLPDPVGPVTRTRPLWSRESFRTDRGQSQLLRQ